MKKSPPFTTASVLDQTHIYQSLLDNQPPMCPVRAALREDVEGGAQRAVGAELKGATVDKSAVGKDNLVPVAWRHTWH